MKSITIETNNIKLHYLENRGKGETIILMHGLTANAHSFNSHLSKLNDFHTISIDLRGRGLSDKPDGNYSMDEHAKDIIGLMDKLGIEKAVLGGHSFGALLSIFIATNYPNRVKKLILIDAAARLHPNLREMVALSIQRLGKTWNSFNDYLENMKASPFLKGLWSEDMISYFQADVKENIDGCVTSQSSLKHITMAIESALGLGEKWIEYISSVPQPAVLINGTDPYGGDDPILPKELAMETVNMMKNCIYKEVAGNHFTMLFGEGTEETANTIISFLKD